MLGSKSKFFHQSVEALSSKRRQVVQLLKVKGYNDTEIAIYIKSYNYFCQNPAQFDGATGVKDLYDIDGLDLDAMLHDYQCIVHNVSSNIRCLNLSNWLFYKGIIRKNKGKWKALKRLIGLTLLTFPFMIYSLIKRGFMSKSQKKKFKQEYKTLIKATA